MKKIDLKVIKDITHKDKKPTNKKNHVGVEIEFFCWLDRSRLAGEFADAGLGDKVKVGYDGSIQVPSELYNAGYVGHEVKVIDDEENIFETIKRVCKVISKWNGQVNKTCGLHIHLDMRNRDYKTCFYNLVSTQHLFYKMNASYRKSGTYCVPNTSKDFNHRRQVTYRVCSTPDCLHTASCFRYYSEDSDTSKYTCVNKGAYNKFKTLEVRVHTGTVDDIKINNWIRVLLAIVKKKDKIEGDIKTVDDFKLHFECDKKLENYIKLRIAKFAKSRNLVETI